MPVDVRTVDLSGQRQADLRAAVEDTGADPQILEALPRKDPAASASSSPVSSAPPCRGPAATRC
jgi:hypothetical protein